MTLPEELRDVSNNFDLYPPVRTALLKAAAELEAFQQLINHKQQLAEMRESHIKELRKQNAELVEALREISSAPVSGVSWLEQCERRMKIAEQALATQPEKTDG